MADERELLRRLVYRSLPDPDFRSRLTARTATGERPVLVALLEDPLSRVLREAAAAGGAANIAVPLLNAIVIVSMTSTQIASALDELGPVVGDPQEISTECTFGVFLQRIISDAPNGEAREYAFKTPTSSAPPNVGRASASFAGAS